MKNKTFNILALVVMFAVIVTTASAQLNPAPVPADVVETATLVSENNPPEPEDDLAQLANKLGLVAVESSTVINMNELVVYIVQLQDPALPSYRGGIKDLEATNPAVRGEFKLDANAPASLEYLDYLAQEQAQAIAAVDAALGRSLNVLYTYKAALNGFAAEMSAAEAAVVAKLPSVKYIEREHEYTLDTDAGPAWMGAPGIWDGTQTGGLPGTYGEGIIIGVIDTGIDPWNPSFADVGSDGYDHTNPWGAGKYVGVCDSGHASYDATFPCNDKLIGAWGYSSVNSGNPRDANGHGSHTASTAGGNFVAGAVITTPTEVYTANISGVAPHANIVAYAACCNGAALTAAKEQVILDKVDVVNYSIGYSSGTADLWASADTQAFLNVRDAGIFVATSAGNSGPNAATMGGPGDAPWMLTVGAHSHDRAFLNSIILDSGTTTTTLNGLSMAGAYGPAVVVHSSNYVISPTTAANARLCGPNAFPAGTFDGQIVVCERGAYGRVAKGQSVRDGGAGGYILAQPDEFGGGPGSLVSEPHVLPGIHIDYYVYQTLRSIVTGTAVVSGTIVGTTLDHDDAHGDVMASFSSRGPIRSDYFIKPDVTAPGRSIWAAHRKGDEDGDYTFNVIGGTSMSSPHAAGAAALLRALHPGWTMAQIQAAMMMTARNTVVDEDGTSLATAFEQGAGHVALAQAAQAGFVLDITTQEFKDANPSEGGNPSALNLASLPNNQCIGSCSWTRVLSSTQAASVSWTASTTTFTDGITLTVTPTTFDLAAYATQIITVEADVSGLPNDVWTFGEVTFVAMGVPDAHFPVAVKASTGVLPSVIEIDAHRDADSIMVRNLQALEIVTMTLDYYGLVEATPTFELLDQDSTRGDPYDAFGGQADGAFYITVTVPADAKRLVAEITDSKAPDLDLFVGQDLDGDGPERSEKLCASTTGSWNEYCNMTDPAAGTWWILVQNWRGSSSQPDALLLATAIVGAADAGNMTITGPDSVPARTEFDLRLFWDIPTMVVGDRWYGAFDIGTDGDHHGNVGTVPVNIVRAADAVSKMATPPVHAGETVTYTIVIQPNDTDEDITYTITDTLPANATFVPGSATNGAMVVNGVLTWNVIMQTTVGKTFGYNMSTSLDDALCAMPLAADDGVADAYVNLEAFNLLANPDVSGDGVAFAAGWSGGKFAFYDDPQSKILYFTDDGYVSLGSTSAVSGTVHPNADIPASGLPDALMAVLWNDMEIVYDQASNRGATTDIHLTSGGGTRKLLEFDGVQLAGDANSQIDFEMAITEKIDNAPGKYEIIFAYDNISGTFDSLTVGSIGVENYDGTVGTKYAYNDAALLTLQDGMAICFDYASFDAVEISYQVEVSSALGIGDTLVNTVCHDTDTPGTEEDCFDVTTTVQGPVPDWDKVILISDQPHGPEDSPFTAILPTDTIRIVDTVEVAWTDNITFTLTEEWSDSLVLEDWIIRLGPDGTLTFPGMNIITDTGALTWTVEGLPNEWTYVLTKTFSIAEGSWDVNYITETLDVEDTLDVDQLDDIQLEFQPMLVPVAAFSATPLTGTVPLMVTFTDASTNVPTLWLWNFGDTMTSTRLYPTHTYTETGVYTVTLTAGNAVGSDLEVKVGYITVQYHYIYMPLVLK